MMVDHYTIRFLPNQIDLIKIMCNACVYDKDSAWDGQMAKIATATCFECSWSAAKWKCLSLQLQATSPDGEAIVTGAGDETLRFWNVFSKSPSAKESTSVLNLFTRIRWRIVHHTLKNKQCSFHISLWYSTLYLPLLLVCDFVLAICVMYM